jgi:hypothetical protein
VDLIEEINGLRASPIRETTGSRLKEFKENRKDPGKILK